MKSKPATVKIEADTKHLTPAISELKFHLDSLGQFTQCVSKCFLNAEKRPSELCKFVRIETNTTVGKRTVAVVSLKPGQLLLDMLAACRTGQFNDFVIKYALHKKSPKKAR